LNYVFHRESAEGKKAIIYGADRDGIIVLQSLIAQAKLRGISPTGFLDDDPKLEGKFLDGYPIFGGHWKLERLVKKFDIGEVILATSNIKPLVLDRIKKVARESGIQVRSLRMSFEQVDVSEGIAESTFTIGSPAVRSSVPVELLNMQEEVE
jgi:FlaA1/EpsC-like NDP-sugar epimerase